MKSSIQAIIKRISHAAKTSIRSMSRIAAPTPRVIPTNCINIHALLLHLCDFDPTTHSYILKWLAYPVQFSGAKMQRALIINGPQGTGATLFFERVIAAMYRNSARHIKANRLDSASNDWASGARFVTIDGRVSRMAGLKALLTSDTVTIHRKYEEDHIEENRMNFVFISQSQDFLPLSACDRRFMIIEAPPAREAMFYQAVEEEIANGGIEAFRKYLMSAVDLRNFNQFTDPPKAITTPHLEFA